MSLKNIGSRKRKEGPKEGPKDKERNINKELDKVEGTYIKREERVRVGFRFPPSLKAAIYAESNRTGRSVTEIVVEQMRKRYEE